jgi:hypothetical protein
MSNNQNENQNTGGTIKPIIQRTNLRPNRSQTTGYEQEDIPDTNYTNQSKPTPSNTVKPSLNVLASVYIPKSLASNTVNSNTNSNAANTDKNIQSVNQPTSNKLSYMLNSNNQAFTPKNNNSYNQQMNINANINPMAQSFNMGQSKFKAY